MSEAGHVFCCALPAVISIISFFSALGVIGFMPSFIFDIHQIMHNWEVTIIIASALTLALGWGLHSYSKKIDCRSSGCGHVPCKPKKNKTERILVLASVLFAFNLAVYLSVHVNDSQYTQSKVIISGHDDHAH